MPTIRGIPGPYRFFFYSFDCNEPQHVHVRRERMLCKFWLVPLDRMFFKDTEKHHVPHIHAEHQGKVAVYSILDGTVLAGDLPPNKHKLIVAGIEIHQEDLLADWDLAVNGKKPFLIKGLDQ